MQPNPNSKDPLERQAAVDKAAERQREQRAKADSQRERDFEEHAKAARAAATQWKPPSGDGVKTSVGKGSSGLIGFAIVAVIALLVIGSKSGQPGQRPVDRVSERAVPPSLPPQAFAESATPVTEAVPTAEPTAEPLPNVVAAEPEGEVNITHAGDAGHTKEFSPSPVRIPEQRVPAGRASQEPQSGPTNDYVGG